jgi:hypothetical protein
MEQVKRGEGLTNAELGEGWNIRTPHRVPTVTSSISRQPRTLQHCVNVYEPWGGLRPNSKSRKLTKKQNDLLEIIKPQLLYLLHLTQNQLNHTTEDTQSFQVKTGCVCVAIYLACVLSV